MGNKGKLFLIPNVIADETQFKVIPSQVIDSLKSIQFFLVEDVRTARRFLSSLKIFDSIEKLEFSILNKDTPVSDLETLFAPVHKGENLGIISESGCPGIADPGALAVHYAHENNIEVVPLVGPSSILLALMASGLNGQRFAFHGYLPIEGKELLEKIKELENESRKKQQTQIFIETPYRNNNLFKALLKTLHAETLLCVAFNLTGSDQCVRTRSVAQWKSQPPEWPKQPAVFLFQAN